MEFNCTASPGLFATIRKSFRDVAIQASDVTIRQDRLNAYARSLKPIPDKDLFDREHHFIGTREQTAAFVLILDSVNFGGTFKKDLAAEGFVLRDHSLYFSTATRIKEIFEQDGGISADKLANLSQQQCEQMFKLTSGPVASGLAAMFARSLRELGEFIRDRHNGRYLGVIEQSGGKVEQLVEELSKLKSFNDIHDYKGIRVPLLKRAQITAADLHLAFSHLGETLFNDVHALTTFPDNAVAHVLHEDGILEYSERLEDIIKRGEELTPGSHEEIEIRASTGHAVELLRKLRPELSAMNIDHILWHRSHEPDYLKRNHHKVRTFFY